MKAKFLHHYNKAIVLENGEKQLDPLTGKTAFKTRFVYAVSGTPAEIAQYIALQGDKLRHQDEDPSKPVLWFSNKFEGNSVQLDFSRDGQAVYANNAERAKVISLIETWGPVAGRAMAQAVANKLLSGINLGMEPEDELTEQEQPKAEPNELGEA